MDHNKLRRIILLHYLYLTRIRVSKEKKVSIVEPIRAYQRKKKYPRLGITKELEDIGIPIFTVICTDPQVLNRWNHHISEFLALVYRYQQRPAIIDIRYLRFYIKENAFDCISVFDRSSPDYVIDKNSMVFLNDEKISRDLFQCCPTEQEIEDYGLSEPSVERTNDHYESESIFLRWLRKRINSFIYRF